MRVSMTLSAGLALAAALAIAPAGAQELKEIESPGAAKHQTAAFRTDTVEVSLMPTKDMRRRHEAEFSIRMKAGDVLTYSLTAPQPEVYHEFHGHTAEAVSFYKKAAGTAHHGSLTAPFDGLHGWYLENRGAKPVKVRLKISGFYELVPPGEEGNEYGIVPLKPGRG